MAKVSSKKQVTLPVEAMRQAGLRPGDEVTVRPLGDGEVIIAARGSRLAAPACGGMLGSPPAFTRPASSTT
jgi:AbrB family looped-hinge helix DNA binding protein